MITVFVAVYSTFPNMESAKNLGRILVEKKLVACVNLIPNILSIYTWQGVIEEESEVIFWAKTQEKQIELIYELLIIHHPYELPAFVIYPIKSGSEPYLSWLSAETSP
jgi:periplasmic divalent cation tolerance protein